MKFWQFAMTLHAWLIQISLGVWLGGALFSDCL